MHKKQPRLVRFRSKSERALRIAIIIKQVFICCNLRDRAQLPTYLSWSIKIIDSIHFSKVENFKKQPLYLGSIHYLASFLLTDIFLFKEILNSFFIAFKSAMKVAIQTETVALV